MSRSGSVRIAERASVPKAQGQLTPRNFPTQAKTGLEWATRQIELRKARLVLRAIEVAVRNVQNLRLGHDCDEHDRKYKHFEEDMVRELPKEGPPDASDGNDSQGAASGLPERALPNADDYPVSAIAAAARADQTAASCSKKPSASDPPPNREELRERSQELGRGG